MTARSILSIILAAGKGTRMKSAMPKPLHAIAGRSMLGHAIATAKAAGHDHIAAIVGPGMDAVAHEAQNIDPGCRTFVQHNQLGTADAALAAREAIAGHDGDVFILFADTPLLQPQTLRNVSSALAAGAQLVVLGFQAADPTGYGRLLTDDAGNLLAIREHNDASESERQVHLCNSGVMAFRVPDLLAILDQISDDNAKREFYLTDAVEIARKQQLSCRVVTCGEDELLGINDRVQLAEAEAQFQKRRREDVMRAGATLIDPATVWFSYDTVVGRDVVIEPNVFFGPRATVEDGAVIHANSHIEGATVRAGARIGPFARLRPGADIGAKARIGNFVEVKNVTMGAGAKANHLAYLGDGTVGADANIGAGTIFCNYDGYNKHRTEVGTGAFIGSNTALVAPVKIGDGAFTGSGSVITRDVPPDALALERADQTVREGWAAKFRTLMSRKKRKS
jgi:bifunctional UDP-N-acetylglucosamine pyrophosphorylase/glucosamine-1-phosphate N-acetyltransferase